MDDELRITENEGDVIYIELCPHKTPIAYLRKKKEYMDLGMSEQDAEYHLSSPIPIELFYEFYRGLFGVEHEAIDCYKIYNPYTGKEIPNDNLL